MRALLLIPVALSALSLPGGQEVRVRDVIGDELVEADIVEKQRARAGRCSSIWAMVEHGRAVEELVEGGAIPKQAPYRGGLAEDPVPSGGSSERRGAVHPGGRTALPLPGLEGVPSMRLHFLRVPTVLAVLCGCASSSASPSAQAVVRRPSTGFVSVEGGRVWYEVHGAGARTPLLVLHGGPGIPHDYLANLDRLGDERPVVFYDQLGCGRSDRPDDPSLWTRERFAREVGTVREALGLEDVVLYGHSWGSLLAVDYLTGAGGTRPIGVRGVILAGPALSIPRWIADSRRLIAALPPETARAILEGERTGQTDTEAYRAATQAFYRLYVCRRDPWPEELERAFAGMGEAVYVSMNGPTEFTITGPLKTVDVTPRLPELRLPALFICGEYDEATPESTRYYAGLTPDAEVVVVEGAAHVANYDRPEEYMRALRHWLDERGL